MKEYILSQCEELEPLIIVDAQWGGGREEIVTTVKQGVGLSLKKGEKKKEVNRPYFGVLALWAPQCN